MNTPTFETLTIKKVTFGGAGEQIFILNNPDDPNAFETVAYDGITPKKLNQMFREIVIHNTAASDCYVSLNPNIAASAAAVNGVFLVKTDTDFSLRTSGFAAVRIYLGGAGSLNLMLKS